MELNKLTVLINRYKRIVELNSNGEYNDKEEEILKNLIHELRKNPRGIIIEHTERYKITIDNFPDEDLRFFCEQMINSDESIEEIIASSYLNGDHYYYEDLGVCEKDEMLITDLDGVVV